MDAEFGERKAERRYTDSGLYEDALNAYSWLGSLFLDGPKIRELLKSKIRTYEEYLRDTYKDQADELLTQSNQETIGQLDALVRAYNTFIDNEEVTNEVAKKYCDDIVSLFREEGKKKRDYISPPIVDKKEEGK